MEKWDQEGWVNGASSEGEEARLRCSAEIEEACLLSADADYKSILSVFKTGYEDLVFWLLTCPQTVCTESKGLLSNASGRRRKTTALRFLFQSKSALSHARQQQVW